MDVRIGWILDQLKKDGLADNTIVLWDVTTQQPLDSPLSGHSEAVWSVAFSPDGQTLASAGDDRTILLWDLTNPIAEPVILSGHSRVS